MNSHKNIEECKNCTYWLVFIYCPQLFPKQLFPKQLFPKQLFPKPMEIPMLKSGWLTPHHPILTAKFSPITAFLSRHTYYCPQWRGRYTPLGRYPLAGTPPGQVHPPRQVHLWAGTPLWAGNPWQVHPQSGTPSRQVPPWQVQPSRQVHPLGRYTPSRAVHAGRYRQQVVVHILLECILVIKVPRASHHPVPKFYGHPKSMNKLTLKEPAIMKVVSNLFLILPT